jgi:hypothetical protein
MFPNGFLCVYLASSVSRTNSKSMSPTKFYYLLSLLIYFLAANYNFEGNSNKRSPPPDTRAKVTPLIILRNYGKLPATSIP